MTALGPPALLETASNSLLQIRDLFRRFDAGACTCALLLHVWGALRCANLGVFCPLCDLLRRFDTCARVIVLCTRVCTVAEPMDGSSVRQWRCNHHGLQAAGIYFDTKQCHVQTAPSPMTSLLPAACLILICAHFCADGNGAITKDELVTSRLTNVDRATSLCRRQWHHHQGQPPA